MVASALPVLAACGGSGGGAGEPSRASDATVDRIPDTGNPRGDTGTIAFDVNPTWNGSDPTREGLIRVGAPGQYENTLNVAKDETYLRFVLADSMGVQGSVAVSIAAWQPGQSHAITVTWGDGTSRLYVDGQLIGQSDYPGDLQLRPGTPLYIASDFPPGASGTITDFHAFNRPLTPEEIARLAGSVTPAVDATPVAWPTPVTWPTPILPLAPDATLRVHSTNVAAAESRGNVCIELIGSAGVVAGTQNDLAWNPSCMEISEPCQANPQHGKSVLTAARDEFRLKALVFSMSNTDPIDDGVLYCCPFRFAPTHESGCCAVRVGNALASDSIGDAILMRNVDGQICLR